MIDSKSQPSKVAIVFSALILFGVGLLVGIYSPQDWLPHPLLLITLALVFLDVHLSNILAVREGKKFYGLIHFGLLFLLVGSLFIVTLISGLRAELTVIVPLVIREITLISRMV